MLYINKSEIIKEKKKVKIHILIQRYNPKSLYCLRSSKKAWINAHEDIYDIDTRSITNELTSVIAIVAVIKLYWPS
ncbi:hypothetical protein GCM10023142_28760 [Anaerocolumna aminovalerica]